MPGDFEYQWGQLVARAWADPAFKAKLLADPAGVLKENGLTPPAGKQFKVVENTDVGGPPRPARQAGAAGAVGGGAAPRRRRPRPRGLLPLRRGLLPLRRGLQPLRRGLLPLRTVLRSGVAAEPDAQARGSPKPVAGASGWRNPVPSAVPLMQGSLAMIRRPRFKPHLRVEVVPGEGVFLLSEQDQLVLQGRLYELVASSLDGSPAEEVCARLRGQASPAEVYYTMGRLEQKGCLDGRRRSRPARRGRPVVDPEHRSGRGGDGGWPRRRSRSASSATWTTGRSASCCGRCASASEDEGRLTVVLTDGYLRSGLEEHNREALATAGRGCWPSRSAPRSGSARCSFPARPAAGAAWRSGCGPTRR